MPKRKQFFFILFKNYTDKFFNEPNTLNFGWKLLNLSKFSNIPDLFLHLSHGEKRFRKPRERK